MLQHLSNTISCSEFPLFFSVLPREDAFQSLDLVHFSTGGGDAGRLQLQGEEEANQKQELAFIWTTKICLRGLLQQLNGLVQAPFLASFHIIPVHSSSIRLTCHFVQT